VQFAKQFIKPVHRECPGTSTYRLG